MQRKYNNPYGSQYVDPVSGMQSTIYPPALLSANNDPKISTSKNWGSNAAQSLSGVFSNLYNTPGTLTPAVNTANTARNVAGAKPLAGANLNNLKGWLGNNFGWDKTSGLKVLGKNLGKTANIGSGIMYGLDAIGGMSDLSKTQSDTDSLISDILRSSASNPLLNSYLTSDQISMLNKIKRGSYDSEASFGDIDLMGLLSSAGSGALSGGLMGGIPGAIIGAIGGGLTSNIERQNKDQALINSELEGLLQSLTDAESQYKMMKRPNFTGLGIQSKYQNMYM